MKIEVSNVSGSGIIAEAVFIKNPKDGNHRGGFVIWNDRGYFEDKSDFSLGVAKDRNDYGFLIIARIRMGKEEITVNEAVMIEKTLVVEDKLRVSILTD